MSEMTEKDCIYRRSRSVAVVTRGGKILMEKVFCFGRFFTRFRVVELKPEKLRKRLH